MFKKPVFRTDFPVSEASVYTRDFVFTKKSRTFFSEFLFWKNEIIRFNNNWDIGQNAFFIFWSPGSSYRFLFLYRSVTNIFIKFRFFESAGSVCKWRRYALKTGFWNRFFSFWSLWIYQGLRIFKGGSEIIFWIFVLKKWNKSVQ